MQEGNKNIKYLHIMHNDKFIAPYIDYIDKNFDSNEHLFLIIGGVSQDKITIPSRENIKNIMIKFKTQNKYWKYLIYLIKLPYFYIQLLNFFRKVKAEKIFFHGLFDVRLIPFLYVFKGFLKKSYWIIWGGDLYCYQNRKKNFIKKLYYKLEDYVKGNFWGYITLNKGDYRLAQQYYGAHGKNYVNQLYPTTLYKDMKFKEFRKEEEIINIQIGNSANPSNNHYEILDKLFKIKGNNEIKIFCILSYGGTKKYVKSIIEYGDKLFGKDFIPIVEFMNFEEYLKYVNNIDIIIFAHKRQQGVGNLTAFLSMKKTIVLRSDVTTYKSYLENGIKVKSFENLDNLEKFDEKILEDNKEIAKTIYSLEVFTKSWKEIFNHTDENEETYEE
jgi:4-alpha-L-fucosyltransferase (fuc4NAc transferase)